MKVPIKSTLSLFSSPVVILFHIPDYQRIRFRIRKPERWCVVQGSGHNYRDFRRSQGEREFRLVGLRS